MDDIDSYYTDRPAYPRAPAPGGRGYPAPHMMRMGPQPPMGRPPMGRPPMGPPMNRPPMGRGMGRPMGPGNMGAGPRPMGPGPMGPNARGPGYTTVPPPRGSSQQQRPIPPFAGNNRPQSPGPQRPAAPYAAPERPRSPFAAENRQADNFTPRDMIPAPLRTRRTPPPPLENMYGPPPPRQRTPSNQAGTPPMKYSPSLGGLAPLDNIGAVRMRSPSPKPNNLSPSLDSIGAPRPPRSASAPRTPLQAGMNTFLEPDWDQPIRQRAHSTNDFGPVTPPILPPAPLKTNDTLPSKAYRMSEQQSNRGYSQQSRPSMVSPRQQHAEDIVLGSDFIEEITVGPYQDLDHPPPPPRKDSYPPVSAKNRILTPPPPPALTPALPRVDEDNSPLPHDRGLRSMFLGDIQAGPYANEDDAPPLPPLPLRARSRSPPIRTPDMSEPASDAEGDEDSPARRMSAFLAGLRISTHEGHDEEDTEHWDDDDVQSASRTNSTLPSTSYCPHMSTGSDTSCDIDFRLDEDPSIAEVEGDIPVATKAPRKPVPSMHEYMSLDQLEDMWGKQDQLGSGGFFGGFDMLPVSVAQDDSRPF